VPSRFTGVRPKGMRRTDDNIRCLGADIQCG
jgi:hypothetical protein